VKFRWDPDLSVLWVGERSYPAHFTRESAQDHIPADSEFWQRAPDWRMETRQAMVCFENQWCLSTIWGDATYSSNHMTLGPRQPFMEEPTQVEVGVLFPKDGGLWGDPLGYVTGEEYHRVADLVMMLPHEIDVPEGEWDTAEGFCDFLITAGLDRAERVWRIE
jgi:hypothetical protein